MMTIQKRLHSLLSLVLSCALLFAYTPLRASESSDTAVLIMSTDRSKAWVKTLRKAVRSAELPYPHQVFFGSADTPDQVAELQTYIRDLEDEGANTIVVVPLLISAFTPVSRQWRYLLGVDMQPGFNSTPFFPIKKRATIRYSEPMNDSAVVVEILLDRAQEISSQPDKETVIVVARGPANEDDNERYSQILNSIATRLRQRGHFKSVESFTLRDEAPSVVRDQAVQTLRTHIQALNQSDTRVLVVALALSSGGLEHKLGLELRGLSYVFNTKALLPDSRISEWIRSQVP
jgi:sirohydrochlorin cobaltochelatase